MNERASYKIEVSFTPDVEVSPEKPYYWALYQYRESKSDWVIEDYHWALTPERAWKEAHQRCLNLS